MKFLKCADDAHLSLIQFRALIYLMFILTDSKANYCKKIDQQHYKNYSDLFDY